MGFMFIRNRCKVKKTEQGEDSEQTLTELETYLEEHKEEITGLLLILWADQKTALTPEEVQAVIEADGVPLLLLETWRQDYSGSACGEGCLLACFYDFLSLLSHTTKDHMPMGVTAHRGLGPPTSNSQENSP